MKPVIERLLDCPPSQESAELVAEFYGVEARIQRHLDAHVRARIAELETRRDALTTHGRDVEAKVARLRAEIGSHNSWTNRLAEQINAASARISALNQEHPSNRSRFPRQEDLDDWATKKAAASEALDAIRSELAAVRGVSQQSRRDLEGALSEVARIVGECTVIGEQVKQLRS
jgi:chromosome segregation ATPase